MTDRDRYDHGRDWYDDGRDWYDDGRDWYDDDDHREAVRRARRATRFGWAAITGVSGLLCCALIAAVGVFLACVYTVVVARYR
ncbi:hypothetical protein [Streptomyces sp. NPDC054834]